VKYTKPPLTFEEQADLLLSRGMDGDRSLMIDRLGAVNYYRLSGYWHIFRMGTSHQFRPNTTFDFVWQLYIFDRRLRLLVMDAIERIEVTARTQLAYHHSHLARSPFGYADDPVFLPQLPPIERARFVRDIEEETAYSKETFVEHFRTKYGDNHKHMPIWVACEIMSFGCVLTFYNGSHPDIKKQVAAPFGVHDVVFSSWLSTLNTIRNICAHHGRLWNRVLGIKPKIPEKNKHPQWHEPVEITNDRIFGILTICKFCLDRIAPQSHWPGRLQALLDEFPKVPRSSMGIPANWRECPIWKTMGNNYTIADFGF